MLSRSCTLLSPYGCASFLHDRRVVRSLFIPCTEYSVQCTVYSVQCTVYSVQCTVYSVQCTVYATAEKGRNAPYTIHVCLLISVTTVRRCLREKIINNNINTLYMYQCTCIVNLYVEGIIKTIEDNLRGRTVGDMCRYLCATVDGRRCRSAFEVNTAFLFIDSHLEPCLPAHGFL